MVCLYAVALGSLPAAPSLVVLDSGEQLVGDILPESGEATLIIRSALLGEVEVPRFHVRSIQPQAVENAPEPETVESVETVELVEPEVAPVASVTGVEAKERKIIETFKELKAPDLWSGNMRLGMNLSRGDREWTETFARGKLEIEPRESPSFYRLTGSYTYRQTERSDGSDFKSTDKYDAEFTYRRSFKESWFVQNAIGYRADQLKGIDREAQESVGVGYKYEPSDRFEVLLGGGGGVEELKTNYDDTRSGISPLVNVFQESTWRPFDRTSFVQKFNYYWNPENSEQFNYVFTAAIRVRLTDLLGFEISYDKNFDNDVGDGDAQDDTRWRNALVVYF